MGRVKTDIHKGEREFHVVTLSDVNAVKGLLALRHKLDAYNDYLEDRNVLSASNWYNVNQELICLYADLDVLIEKCGLHESQKALLDILRCGFTFQDIAEYMGIEERRLSRMFNKICKRIVEYHRGQWLSWISLNYIKISWKTCRICRESFPATDKFYNKRTESDDGLRSECVFCKRKLDRESYSISDGKMAETPSASTIGEGLIYGQK